ncbi:hypothetical protein G5C51_32030 [Streptomyces sp. A7024]|uniref:Ricin B lectin domain-containing protein n=1 Tax=Streptomyces coryli TaxID=1128680 RepID=A0A6G4U8K2_9ACTN|nr:hypothetical protein [Streptomyces coryli]NGN68514.1 hypothetical protein [Streptomyces coryli]
MSSRGRHRTSRWKLTGGAAAAAIALTWTAMGMPGWASEDGAQSAAEAAAATKTAAVGAVACDDGEEGDGKGRYQPVYVYRAEGGARESGPAAVRQVIWDVDQTFEASAKRYAGYNESRRPRFVQDEDCKPTVMSVAVEGLGEEHAMGDVREKAQEAVRQKVGAGADEWLETHRLLLFYDTGKPDGCGTAGAPGPDSRADSHSGWAEVSWDCAGEGAMTHEMIHNFGVTHCDEDKAQGNDPICRGYDETPRCSSPRSGAVLDCGRDDFAYFHPRPAKGTPLAGKPAQNVARSPYLISDKAAQPVAARLADAEGGKCLAPDGDGLTLAACGGDDQTWVREISGHGWFKFKLGEKCLAKGEGGSPVLEACAKTAGQHWWVEENQGDARNGYGIVHRSGGEPVAVDGAKTFVMKG